MSSESANTDVRTLRPRTLFDALFGWMNNVPWWALLLVGAAVLGLILILSPAKVTGQRVDLGSTGGRSSYTLLLHNDGPAEAVNLVVTERLPERSSLVSAEPKPAREEEDALIWEVASLKSGSELAIALTLTGAAPAEGPLDLAWTTVSLDILRFLSLGMQVTVTVTLYSFLLAVALGLIAGLGRVTKQPEGIRSIFTLSYFKRGLLRVTIGLAAYWALIQAVDRLPSLTPIVIAILAVLLYLAPRALHPYTLSTLYVEVFRGVPMLVQVLYLGFVIRPYLKTSLSGLLGMPVEFSEFGAAVLGLGLGYGAYIAEVFRAGIQSIHRGQMEAARSLGMSYAQAMRHVILPQAIRRVLPPLANDGVALLKDSSFVSVLSVADLTRQGRLYMSRTYRAFESWNMVAASYLVLTFLFSGLARTLERRMSQGER